MAKALDHFLSLAQKPSVNEIFFRYQGFEYQICLAGRYIIVEDSTTGDAEEFCFSETGEALLQAILNAAPRGTAIRAILDKLAENELIDTV
ncbi:MAG: hypothetical protein MJ033_04800 [Victivallaceae bacterium]|nr:hypothetical protein [Victivallaceae bacterium]